MTTKPPFPRNENHYCQECGQGYLYHSNFPATATEPPEQWRCKMKPDGNSDSVYSRDEIWAEYERNHNHDYDNRHYDIQF